MENIELKVKVNDFRKIKKLLKLFGAKYEGVLKQKDVYFRCPKGRLKIREINNRYYELIYYQRPNKTGRKTSNYTIWRLSKARKKQIENIFVILFGIKVVVRKTRILWHYKNTRIHLDQVNTLGNFLEIETVLNGISKKQGEKEYFEIINFLELDNFKKIKVSYSDLLLRKR